MNRLRLVHLIIALTCLVSFTSCDKDDDDDVSPNVSLLTAGEWKATGIYFGNENLNDDFLEETGYPVTDLSTTFDRDGTYIESLGPNSVEGTWKYENNERIIIFDEDSGREYNVVISKLDEDEFNYIQGGIEYRFTR